MLKKISLTLFTLVLIFLFIYGYIKVYTISYNTLNREPIIGFSFKYSQEDKTLYATICGNDFEINI